MVGPTPSGSVAAGPGPQLRVGGPPAQGIVTPEAVLLSFEEAGVASRSLAFVIDVVLRIVAVWVLFLVVVLVGFRAGGAVAVVLAVAVVFAAVFVYPMAFETLVDGRTPGKMILGLRVVTTEGGPVRLRHAAIRSAFVLVDFVLGGGAIAVVSALVSRHGQRLGDLVAGTVVIRQRQTAETQRAVQFAPPPGWEAYAASLDTRALPADLAVLVRTFLLRVHEVAPDARLVVADDLAGRVARLIGVELGGQTNREAFLVSVVAAEQARPGRHGGPGPASGGPPTVGDPGIPAISPAETTPLRDTWGAVDGDL